MRGRILIVDDEKQMCELIATDLQLRDFDSRWFTDAEQAFAALETDTFDVVLTDLKMPSTTGIELCQRIVAYRPDVPVIVMTAFGSLDTAVAAIRAGAYDFVTKPIELDVLAISILRATDYRQLNHKVKTLSETLEQTRQFDDIIGESDQMRRLFDQLSRIADSDVAVLISGESGTGKELIARALHRKSRRQDGPFVAVNCAALPEGVLESELFGHLKGAFTDAHNERKGMFLEADRGTLLLDEVGELPMSIQPKLLRALEERTVRPVGSSQELSFDARIVTATNRDLESLIASGQFREDLFYRINVMQIDVPPLRSRGTDVLLLAQRFIQQFAAAGEKHVKGMTEAVAEKLLNYPWRGNVRELRNIIERAVALTRFEQISIEDVPQKVREYEPATVALGGDDPSDLEPLSDIEQRYILHVLAATGGNKTRAARILGLDRKTLYRKLQEHGEADSAGP